MDSRPAIGLLERLPQGDLEKLHVEMSTTEATLGRRCVDWRYMPEQGKGKIARPGGDFGYVMVLLALRKEGKISLSPEQCVNAIYNYSVKKGGRFSMHTDSSAAEVMAGRKKVGRKEKSTVGCRHITFATERPDLYGVLGEDVERAVSHIMDRVLYGALFDVDILSGEGEAHGFIVVDGVKKSVHSFNPQTKTGFFVFDSARDEIYSRELVSQIGIPGVTSEDFLRISQKQTAATVSLLDLQKSSAFVNLD